MTDEVMLPAGFILRQAGVMDDSFLFALFCSTRTDLALLPLPQAQLEQLLRQQYEWQQKGYASQYPEAENWIIENASGAVGKIMLFHAEGFVHVIDFIVAAQWRNQGIGSLVLTALKNHVAKKSIVLHLSVDRQNVHARRLYLQQGFSVGQISDTHEQLFWSGIE